MASLTKMTEGRRARRDQKILKKRHAKMRRASKRQAKTQ